MLTFYEWLDEVAKFYFNQQTYDKWIPELLDKAITKAMEIASRNPDKNWMRYNLPYWQQHKDELIQRLEPMTQEIFDNQPGIPYSSLMTRMIIAIGQIFQKEPYTRRHVAYADSLGKHPDEIEKRKPGRQVGWRKPAVAEPVAQPQPVAQPSVDMGKQKRQQKLTPDKKQHFQDLMDIDTTTFRKFVTSYYPEIATEHTARMQSSGIIPRLWWTRENRKQVVDAIIKHPLTFAPKDRMSGKTIPPLVRDHNGVHPDYYWRDKDEGNVKFKDWMAQQQQQQRAYA